MGKDHQGNSQAAREAGRRGVSDLISALRIKGIAQSIAEEV